MKHFFSKSSALLLFSFSLSFVISLSGSLVWSVSNRPDTYANDNDSIVIWVAAGFFLLLLLLNATDIVLYWIRGKEKELYVKQLVGIEQTRILKALYSNFVVLIALASSLGVALAFVVISICSSFLPLQLHLLVFLLSFLFSLLVLIVFCTVVVLYTPIMRFGEK